MPRGFFVHILNVYKRFSVILSQVRMIWYLWFVLKEIVCYSLHLCKVLCKEKVMLCLSWFSLQMFTVYCIVVALIVSISFPQTVLPPRRDQTTCAVINFTSEYVKKFCVLLYFLVSG